MYLVDVFRIREKVVIKLSAKISPRDLIEVINAMHSGRSESLRDVNVF